MEKLNYYSHLLLNSRYSFVIKLTIIFSIYALFYLDTSNDIAYCTQSNKKKLEKALEEIKHLQQEVDYLQNEQQRFRTWAFVDPRLEGSVTFTREEGLHSFKNAYYPFASYHYDYELSDGRIIRHFGGKTRENVEHLAKGTTGIDFFYYIRVNPNKIVSNIQEVYCPPNHPANGYKPHGEAVQTYLNSYYEEKDIPWTLQMCNIL